MFTNNAELLDDIMERLDILQLDLVMHKAGKHWYFHVYDEHRDLSWMTEPALDLEQATRELEHLTWKLA